MLARKGVQHNSTEHQCFVKCYAVKHTLAKNLWHQLVPFPYTCPAHHPSALSSLPQMCSINLG